MSNSTALTIYAIGFAITLAIRLIQTGRIVDSLFEAAVWLPYWFMRLLLATGIFYYE